MLLKEPLFYFKQILEKYPNSYLAEDSEQIIIGIDCAYISGDDFALLKREIENGAKTAQSWFAGLFGVLSFEAVYSFEKIGEKKAGLYEFPTFCYANAKSYLYYEKQSKLYSYFGEHKYFEFLSDEWRENEAKNEAGNSRFSYEILSDLEAEKKDFEKAIERAKEYICSGDAFQIVLSKTLHLRSNLAPLSFYERLKKANPSNYMFYFPTPFGVVAGSSPELVMQIKRGEIFVAPIAGTRPRGVDANHDERLAKELLSDEKEIAEHKMLVDLARNDVGKFAKASSVKVKNLMHIERFESVMHIVSEVYGTLDERRSSFDALRVIFPAGTLSGSPKIRALQIINELETHARGIYGGGIGFWHFSGDMQMAILIRSGFFVPSKNGANDVYIGAGAGIVYDSIAQNEYAEICNKRKSCLKIFEEL